MASAVVAAVAVVLILVALAIVVRRVAGSQHTFDAALRQLDADMQVFTRRVGHVVERASEARDRGVRELELVFDLDALLLRVAASAAVRTDAEAAAVRVQGAGPAPVARSFGAEEVGTLLEGTLHPPGEGQFRALTVNWTLGASFDRDAAAFRSALVVPILEEGLETGALAAYARSPAAFRPEHARALEELAAEAARGLPSARRVAELALRLPGPGDAVGESGGRDVPTTSSSRPLRASRTVE